MGCGFGLPQSLPRPFRWARVIEALGKKIGLLMHSRFHLTRMRGMPDVIILRDAQKTELIYCR